MAAAFSRRDESDSLQEPTSYELRELDLRSIDDGVRLLQAVCWLGREVLQIERDPGHGAQELQVATWMRSAAGDVAVLDVPDLLRDPAPFLPRTGGSVAGRCPCCRPLCPAVRLTCRRPPPTRLGPPRRIGAQGEVVHRTPWEGASRPGLGQHATAAAVRNPPARRTRRARSDSMLA